MTAELAVRSASLPEKIAYADNLACSGMLPKQFQGKPANILWATEYGETLGITTMAAINGIHVIENKPSASAALIGGLVRRAGHKLRVTGNSVRATAQIVRADDPDFVFEVTWELKRNPNGNPNAEEAGLLNKSTWKNYPAAMLKSRAITQVARDACEEVLFGLHYTPEELGAEVDAEGEPVEARAQRVTARPVEHDPWETPVQDGPVAVEPEYAEVVGEPSGPALATDAQLGQLADALVQVRGATSTEAQRTALAQILGPDVDLDVRLSRPNVERALSALRREVEQQEKLDAQDARKAERAAETAPAGEWATPAPSPMVPVATGEQITQIAQLLAVKRNPNQAAWNLIVSSMVRRQIDDVRTLTKAEATRIVETLTAEPDLGAQQAATGPTPADPVASNGKQRAMHALFREKGIGDDDKHAFITRVLGHDIETMARITRSQCEAVLKALNTGEVPPAAVNVAPAEEGFNILDALHQMILDVRSETTFVETQQAIDAEQQRGEISAEAAQGLRERLAKHVETLQTGAAA